MTTFVPLMPTKASRDCKRQRERKRAAKLSQLLVGDAPPKRRLPLTHRKPMGTNRRMRFGVFDLETAGFGDGVLFATACYEGKDGRIYETVEFEGDLIPGRLLEWILSDEERRKCTWYAHNANFDWRYFHTEFLELLLQGYNIIPRARMKGVFYELQIQNEELDYTVTFRDSLAILPMSLKEAMAKLSTMDKLDIGLADGTTFDPSNELHRKYARRDSEGLLDVLINYDQLIYDHFNIHVRGTVAGNAYNAFLRMMPSDTSHWRLKPTVEEAIRKAYHGGIVYLTTCGKVHPEVFCYDINSSYPNVMRRYGVPCGNPVKVVEYDSEHPGFYLCHVRCTERDMFHFIPYRTPEGALRWTYGEFETWITSDELEAGLAHGYEIEVIKGYVFPRLEYPFTDFVSECERLRKLFKGQSLEMVAKLMQNSLYGKFGSKPMQHEYIFTAQYVGSETGFVPCVDEDDGLLSDCAYTRMAERDSEYMLPHWAAWITAHARLELVKIIDICGYDNFLYCDTDSVTCLRPGSERIQASGIVGSEYGQVKHEATYIDWVSYAPKYYVARGKRDLKTGEITYTYPTKCKGLPKKVTDETVKRQLHEGEKVRVQWEGPTSYLAFMQTGKYSRNYNRTPTDPTKLTNWEIEGHTIRPIPQLPVDSSCDST